MSNTQADPLALHPLPDGWHRLGTDERHSTIAYFEGGYRNDTESVEVLVWRGVGELYAVLPDGTVIQEHDDRWTEENVSPEQVYEGTYIEGPEQHSVADPFTHLVTVVGDEEGDYRGDYTLAEGIELARSIVRAYIERLTPSA